MSDQGLKDFANAIAKDATLSTKILELAAQNGFDVSAKDLADLAILLNPGPSPRPLPGDGPIMTTMGGEPEKDFGGPRTLG